MDFEKYKAGFLEGKKQKIFFKDGTNVFTHGLPLSLYRAVLEQEPSIEKYTEPDGATPLFYVDSVKKFDRLVEHGFDIYAKDNDGISLDQALHPSIFVNLSDDALRGFESTDEEFLEFFKDRLKNTKRKLYSNSKEKDFGGKPLILHSKMLGHNPGLDNKSDHTPHSPEHDYVFTTDARNQFKTFTTKEGYEMLENLAKTLQPVLESLSQTPGFSVEKGFKIYTEKENLKSGATWSAEEYADPSLLYQYCLNKAMQRFPESIEMMNAAFELGAIPDLKDRKEMTVISIGGGCSYELLAVKEMFSKHAPKIKLRLISLDYEPFWRNIVEPLGIEFDQIDFNKPVGELKKQLDPYKADFYVMSFVYRTYIKQQHQEFIHYLCKSSFGIYVNDRNTEYLTFDIMNYNLSKSGYLTLISNEYEGYPYVSSLTLKGYPKSIYKDTPWSKVGVVRKSGKVK